MSTHWFYSKNGVQHGPVSLDDLKSLAQSGALSSSDLVRRDGTVEWRSADSVMALIPVFSEARPDPDSSLLEAGENETLGNSSPKKRRQNQSKPNATGWNGLSAGTRRAILGGGAAMFASCFLCCGIGVFMGHKEEEAARKTLADANSQWEAGQKATAVEKYKSVLRHNASVIPEGERATVYQRTIDFDAAKGNTDSVEDLIGKALDQKIQISLSDPKAKLVQARIVAERQARASADKKDEDDRRAKEDADSSGDRKLSALKRIVYKLKSFPDRLASREEREKYNKELAIHVNEFTTTKFVAKYNRRAAKEIVELYESKIHKQYSGQLFNEIDDEVRQIIHDLTS